MNGAASLTDTAYEQIAWQILVDGQAIRRILSLELDQAVARHHHFTLRLYHTELETPRTYRIDKTRELLGKTLSVILGTQVNGDLNRFTGLITEVGFEEANGMYGIVVLKGYSPTILLESGPHMRSFYNRNLSGIAGDVTGSVSGKLDVQVKPRFTGNLEYTVQHKESHFAFLNRLSAYHGEWFYYDGVKLCLGRNSAAPSFDLQYVRHLQNLKMNLQVVPLSFNHLGYRPQDDQKLQKTASGTVDGLDSYGNLAVQKSDQVFSQPVTHTPVQYATDQGSLDRATTVNRATAAAQTFAIEAESRYPAPQVGARIRIKFGETILGEYVVTEAYHKVDNVKNYHCRFRALPADIETLPPMNVQTPYSDTQLAQVTDNADPEGMGRVRVQFGWQQEDSMTPWLRVMTPDAGGSSAVPKNRGFVFIPEIGDQVMVGFMEGNPDAPFVMGSVFHGKNGAGGETDNITKSITTRSGHTIEFNDEGEGTHILLRDPSGNEIFLDTVGKSIVISAPETITLRARNINLDATQSISASAGENINQTAGMHFSQAAMLDYTLTALNITEIADQDMLKNAANIEKTAGSVKFTSTSDNVELHSAKDIENRNNGKIKLF